ncbi:MAG: hypothetical protein ACOY0S_02405 [Patescibacteria group bacterium]
MADLGYYETNRMETGDIGQLVDELVKKEQDKRLSFERRWYDNNFFDDGYHFRYLSRTEGRVVDISERQTIWNPLRAIPKASRQIRGVANLLLANDPRPVVYPEEVSKAQYPAIPQLDPRTSQPVLAPNPEYEQARQEAKRVALAIGHWLEEEIKDQALLEKLAFMVILTAKHGVSYLQVWPDVEKEAIKTQVYDAFDIYLDGTLTEIGDSPYLIKGIPKFIAEIKANPDFDNEQKLKINPDNRQASSDIKNAYMEARHSQMGQVEQIAKVILKEAFLKEHLNQDNIARIRRQKNGERILRNKKEGDTVIRQIFVAGNIWLKDTYLPLPDYPFVDFRMEPGPIYQVPLIERFIPQNKSLDLAVSRLERFFHTMNVGIWLKRQGEQVNISNLAGGQIIEYQGAPPVQGNIASPSAMSFPFLSFLDMLIQEQGVTTSTLGKIPQGVKAHAAIESLKESEYSNLIIASRRLKGTIKRIAEKFMDLADDYFVTPRTVYYLEKGEPQYFDIIGNSALQKRQEVKVETPQGVIPIKKDYKVEIEVQAGLGYTREGKKQSALQLGEYLMKLVQLGAVPSQVVVKFIENLLETFEFGATSEIMEAFEGFEQAGMTDQQILAMKTAIAEVIRDTGIAEKEDTTNEDIQKTKVAVAEVAKDLQGGEV